MSSTSMYILVTHDEMGMETTLHSTDTEAYEALREYLNARPVDYQDPLPEDASQDLIKAAADDRSQFSWEIQEHTKPGR